MKEIVCNQEVDLPDLNDLQAVYNYVLTFMRKQNKAAAGVGGSCRYRLNANDNVVLACAVGCLIPDRIYAEAHKKSIDTNYPFEGCSVNGTGDRAANLRKALNRQNARLDATLLSMLGQLQTGHDQVLRTKGTMDDEVEVFFKQIATSRDLDYFEPEEAA